MKKKTAKEQIKVDIEPIQMVQVKGGTFTMGIFDPGDVNIRILEASPPHKVTLSSYYIGKYQVTQKQWRDIVQWKQGKKKFPLKPNPSEFSNDDFPVTNVSWYEIQTWLLYLNEKEGLTGSTNKYRLPTEAEWEFAACGGMNSKGYMYSGSNNIDDVGWYDAESWRTSHAVGTKAPNELGLFDMTGNVREWCNDFYSPYAEYAQINPTGPENGSGHCMRGGIHFLQTKKVDEKHQVVISTPSNVLKRHSEIGSVHYDFIGFRLARTSTFELMITSQEISPLVEIKPIEMVLVDGGTFIMGGDDGPYSNANPPHSVTLSNFYIGKYPVTQKQWRDIVQWKQGSGGVPLKPDPDDEFFGDNFPVTRISWKDVQKWLSFLNEKEGLTKSPNKFRLPTEAEWEFAARGGTKSQGYIYSGSNNLDKVAWCGKNSGKKPHDVRTKKPNELGIFDMTGNVDEWCNDWYEPYTGEAQTNPTGPSKGKHRVLRGGSWCICSDYRLVHREHERPEDWFSYWGLVFGFRIARTA
jgi:formylglycine-generating enzyme required for sulfatase activity